MANLGVVPSGIYFAANTASTISSDPEWVNLTTFAPANTCKSQDSSKGFL